MENLAKQWMLLLKPPVSTLKAVVFQILDVIHVANKYGNKFQEPSVAPQPLLELT